MVFHILDGDLLNSALLVRSPFRLWFKLANLHKISICDVVHAGNRTQVAEFASHIDSH